MAPDAGPITATRNVLVRLLGGGPARVSLDGGAVRFGDAAGTPVGAIDRIGTRRSWLWTRLTIREAAGAEHSIGGLDREEAERLAEAVRAGAARVAEEIAPQLTELDDRLKRFQATNRYRRHSMSSGLQADIAAAARRSGGALMRTHLAPSAA